MAPDELHRVLASDPSHPRISALVIEEAEGSRRLRVTYAGMGRVHPSEVGSLVDMSQVPDEVAVRVFSADPDRYIDLAERPTALAHV